MRGRPLLWSLCLALGLSSLPSGVFAATQDGVYGLTWALEHLENEITIKIQWDGLTFISTENQTLKNSNFSSWQPAEKQIQKLILTRLDTLCQGNADLTPEIAGPCNFYQTHNVIKPFLRKQIKEWINTLQQFLLELPTEMSVHLNEEKNNLTIEVASPPLKMENLSFKTKGRLLVLDVLTLKNNVSLGESATFESLVTPKFSLYPDGFIRNGSAHLFCRYSNMLLINDKTFHLSIDWRPHYPVPLKGFKKG